MTVQTLSLDNGATINAVKDADGAHSFLLAVRLPNGEIFQHYYHWCDNCTSADTWAVRDTPDQDNHTGDPYRRTVDVCLWDREGRRHWDTGTTTNHVIRHDGRSNHA